MKHTEGPKRLICCCCGNETIGRQWYNRDAGYGLCSECADSISKKESPEQMHSNYGVLGFHYKIVKEGRL